MQVGVQNMPKMMLKAWQNEETCFQKHVSAIVSPVAKLGNTEETCARYECVWKHVSSFCQAFTQFRQKLLKERITLIQRINRCPAIRKTDVLSFGNLDKTPIKTLN